MAQLVKADPFTVVPILCFLVTTGQATEKQKQELAEFFTLSLRERAELSLIRK